MSNDRKFSTCVTDCLIQPTIGIASLDALAFEMHAGESIAHDIGAVYAALKLLSTLGYMPAIP